MEDILKQLAMRHKIRRASQVQCMNVDAQGRQIVVDKN